MRIVGAPMTLGQPLNGTDNGPDLLREKGLIQGLTKLDWRIEDTGNLEFPKSSSQDQLLSSSLGKAKKCVAVVRGNEMLYQTCLASLT